MCETLAKRIVCIILLCVEIPNVQIAEKAGVSERTVRDLKKAIEAGKKNELFTVHGGGRKSKLANLENVIIEEIESNNYHSRQQVADMIHEKHGIKISVSAVGKMLKKTKSNA